MLPLLRVSLLCGRLGRSRRIRTEFDKVLVYYMYVQSYARCTWLYHLTWFPGLHRLYLLPTLFTTNLLLMLFMLSSACRLPVQKHDEHPGM